jgi:hypothetical protein
MKIVHSLTKSPLRVISTIMLVVILCCGAFAGCIAYANWSAERGARGFCGETPIGSDISAATARANDRKILWGPHGGYTFYFPGFIFDKATCEIWVDRNGKVISKSAAMEYD